MPYKVDARGGLSCPQPVVLAKKAVEGTKEKVIEVLVDNGGGPGERESFWSLGRLSSGGNTGRRRPRDSTNQELTEKSEKRS